MSLFITDCLTHPFVCYIYDDRGVKMSEAIDDPFAYTHLTDGILQDIKKSTDPNLEEV